MCTPADTALGGAAQPTACRLLLVDRAGGATGPVDQWTGHFSRQAVWFHRCLGLNRAAAAPASSASPPCPTSPSLISLARRRWRPAVCSGSRLSQARLAGVASGRGWVGRGGGCWQGGRVGSDGALPTGRRVDFFVSHASQDQAWAEWLAWQLMQAGYSVELAVWDWAPGQDFLARMQQALGRADRLLAVWSPAYFRSTFGTAELRAAFVRQAREAGRVVPVLVAPATVPELYTSLIHIDLVGLDEAAAAERLRTRLAGGRPAAAPRFPVAAAPAVDKPAFAGRPP